MERAGLTTLSKLMLCLSLAQGCGAGLQLYQSQRMSQELEQLAQQIQKLSATGRQLRTAAERMEAMQQQGDQP